MATTIYYVRHGENLANLTREFSYKLVDYSLTDRGIVQAGQTADHFRSQPITAIYTSPLKRARETAEIIAAALHLSVNEIEHFREVNVGALECQPPTDETWSLHDRIFAAWLRGEASACFPDGENHKELLARVLDGLTYVTSNHRDEEVIVVAHGGILNATITALCPEAYISQPDHIPNCSITALETYVDHGKLRCYLRNWANCSHL